MTGGSARFCPLEWAPSRCGATAETGMAVERLVLPVLRGAWFKGRSLGPAPRAPFPGDPVRPEPVV